MNITCLVVFNVHLYIYNVFGFKLGSCRNFEFLIPDAPELIATFLESEQDASCKRNAFMMLIHADQVVLSSYYLLTIRIKTVFICYSSRLRSIWIVVMRISIVICYYCRRGL